jgi:hypothetical protein
MAAPDEPRPPLDPFGRLDRRAFLARLGAAAAAGAVAAYLPAWADRPRLLALRPPPPRPLGAVWFDHGRGPVEVFHDDGLPALPEGWPASVRERLRGAEAACYGPGVLGGGCHAAEITFDGWVTYTCVLEAQTPGAFSPLALPALVPFVDAPPPPPRLAAAIAAYRGGPEGTRLVQPSGLVLGNVWMWGPGPAGAAGAVGRAEPAAAAFERTYGAGAPWSAGGSARVLAD